MLSPNRDAAPHTADPDTSPPPRRPLLDLSLTQLVGGSLAAATGAALASRLGVAGTILGAACVSLISAVAGAAYTQSLRTTRARVRTVSGQPPRSDTEALGTRAAGSHAAGARPTPPPVRRLLRPQAVLAAAAAVFVIAFASITGYELLTGAPISGGSGGTTLNEVTGTGQAAGTEPGTDGEHPERDDPASDDPTRESLPPPTTTSGPSTSGATGSTPTQSVTPSRGSTTSAPPSDTDPTPTPSTPPTSSAAPTTPPLPPRS